MKRVLTFIYLITLGWSIQAQDIHFSQFYAVPTTLNPALTGFFSPKTRIAGIYRSQWASFAPFTTQAVSYERRVLPALGNKDPGKTTIGGIALTIVNDKAGINAGLSTLKGYASTGFNFDLGFMTLGAGAQVGYVQRNLFGINRFPDQWDAIRNVFDQSAPTNDNNISPTETYLDFNAGVLGTKKFGDAVEHRVFLGASVFHINQPEEKFINTSFNRMRMRVVVHGGARIRTGESKPISIIPSGVYMYIPYSGSIERNAGLDVEYDFNQVNSNFHGKFMLGGYYRIGDAIIAHTAMEFNDFAVGLSYDINSSELREATNMRGGFELSLRYMPKPLHTVKRLVKDICPTI